MRVSLDVKVDVDKKGARNGSSREDGRTQWCQQRGSTHRENIPDERQTYSTGPRQKVHMIPPLPLPIVTCNALPRGACGWMVNEDLGSAQVSVIVPSLCSQWPLYFPGFSGRACTAWPHFTAAGPTGNLGKRPTYGGDPLNRRDGCGVIDP